MTLRSVILGLIGAAVITSSGFIISQILKLSGFTSGGLLPLGALVPMMLGALLVGLLRVFGVSVRFRPGELAVIAGLLMAGVSVLGGQVQPTLPTALALPAYYNQLRAGWRKNQVLSYVPPAVLPADGKYDSQVVEGFLGGLGGRDKYIPLSSVPWAKWSASLTTWLPMMALAGICMACLGLIVHRQWSERERLRYPIATFAIAMLSGRTEDRKPLYRNGMFLAGFLVVLCIFMVNGLQKWYPNSIKIPMTFNLGAMTNYAFQRKWPIFLKAPFADHLLDVRISVIAIAFSFFLASDVSLSLGLSQAIFVPIGMWMLTMGIELKSDYMEGGATAWGRFGSYLAFGLMLAYFGRRYYWNLLVQTFSFRNRPQVAPYEAWACRILLLAAAGMAVMIARLGLAWPLAVLTVGMMVLLLVIVSRIAAETGLFSIQARWQPLGVFLGMLGAYALGPQAIIMIGLFCTMLTLAPGSKLSPFFASVLKVCSDLGAKPSRVGVATGGVYLAGIVIAVVATLWASYNFGQVVGTYDIKVRAPTMSFQPAERAITRMKTTGELDACLALGPIERILNARPERKFLWAAGLGFVAVILFSSLRLRFSWWPLHPVMFLVWATWPMGLLSHSFFLGWLARTIVIRIGGHAKYQQAKVFMIGAIAGNLAASGFWMVVGLIYYAATGMMPPA